MSYDRRDSSCLPGCTGLYAPAALTRCYREVKRANDDYLDSHSDDVRVSLKQ